MADRFSGIAFNVKGTDYLIILDLVTRYSTNFKARVTSHPVDGGVNGTSFSITDHVVLENPTIQLSALISPADFLNTRPKIDSGTYVVNLLGGGVINDVAQSTKENWAVTVTEPDRSAIDVITGITGIGGGILTPAKPNVNIQKVDRVDISTKQEVKDFLRETHRGGKLVDLYEVGVTDLWPDNPLKFNWIVTDLSFDEDEDSGDCVNVSLTLEQVNIVTSQKVKLPNVASGQKKKASGKKNKGKIESTPQPVTNYKTKLDPLTGDIVTVEDKPVSASAGLLSILQPATVAARTTAHELVMFAASKPVGPQLKPR